MSNIKYIKPKNVQNIIDKFCMTIGILPSTYKLALSYEEQILCIGKYLEETVYPAINNNAEALLQLQELFANLKEYVENYIENLDIQQDVNNKLDEMAGDGTLEELINQEIFGDLNKRTSLARLYMPSLLSSVGSEMISLFKTENKAVLFDTGRSTSVASNKQYLEEKLGTQKINAVFISHYHGDHMGGLEGLKDLYADDVVVYLPLNFIPYYNGTDDTAPIIAQRAQVINFLTQNNINYVEIDTDRTIDFEDFTVETTNSNPEAYSHYNQIQEDKYNSYSMNCLVRYGKTKLLFPGDSTVDTQDYLLSQNKVEKVNVLCSFHHGYERYKNTKYMLILNPDFEYYAISPLSWNSVNLLQYDYAYNTNPIQITSQAYNSIEYNISKYGVEMVNGNFVKENMFPNKIIDAYINPNFNGVPDGTETAPFKSIAQALTYYPKTGCNLRLHLADGTYTNLRFYNLMNTVSILAINEGEVVFEDVQINNCSAIYFNGIKFSQGFNAVYGNEYFSHCEFNCPASTVGNIAVTLDKTQARFLNCTFQNCYTGLYVITNSICSIDNCIFDCSSYGIYAVASYVSFNSNNTLTSGTLRADIGATICSATKGNTSGRPNFNKSNFMRGYQYFDTSLGIPVFYYNSTTDERWIDAGGNVV